MRLVVEMSALHFVVIYNDLLAPGGIPYETRALVGGLLSNGVRVTALCNPRDCSQPGASAVITDFAREEGRDPPTIMEYELRSLLRVLRAEDRRRTVFVLIGCRRAEYLAVAMLIRHLGFRSVVFPHGLLAPELLRIGWNGRSKGWLRRRAEQVFQFGIDRPLLRKTTIARALSVTEAKRLKSLGCTSLFVSADGVDRSWLAVPTLDASAPRDQLRLLYLGRPEPFQKGLDILFRAIDGLDTPEAVALTLAGPDEDRFRQVVVEAIGHCPGWVRFAGMVTGQAKRRVMSEAHFLVHFSRFEGMAKCVREAVGQGLPVLASYESNFGDWVQTTGAGFATAASVAAVRETVLRASRVTPTEWSGMREAAWRFAQDNTWDKVAARVISEITAHAEVGPISS